MLPYVFVADDAFGLKKHMVKPHPFTNLGTDKLIFNCRISRARRVIENTFGMAASRFRVFLKPIIAKVEKVKVITKSVVALHNFLMTKNEAANQDYCPSSFIDRDGSNGTLPGELRRDQENITGMVPVSKASSNKYAQVVKIIRDILKDYFNNEGAVDWQWDLVNRRS